MTLSCAIFLQEIQVDERPVSQPFWILLEAAFFASEAHYWHLWLHAVISVVAEFQCASRVSYCS